MTAETRDMRPDFWKPEWLARAEYDGETVTLVDMQKEPHSPRCIGPEIRRYQVYCGAESTCRRVGRDCDGPSILWGQHLWDGDDEAEARAAFDRACEELRNRI